MGIVYDKVLGKLREGGNEGGGSGDMLQSVYDTNGDGVVDQAEDAFGIGGKSAAEVAAAVEASANIPVPGVDGGFAPLSGGKIPVQYLGINTSTHVVADMAARNTLAPVQSGERAFVRDASADPTVNSGAAEYIWDGATWFKIAEAESLDLILDWGNLINKPTVFPPSAHSHAVSDVNGLQTQLSTFAPSASFIMPGLINTYEGIFVGPTRTYKTLADAYAYMRTKNMGSKGFSLMLDPGTYAGILFENCTLLISSSDRSDRAVITGNLDFSNCSYAGLTHLKLTGRVCSSFSGYTSIGTVDIVTSDTRGIIAENGCFMDLGQVTVVQTAATAGSIGVLASDHGYIRTRGLTVQGGWQIGIQADLGSVKLVGTTVSGCFGYGLYARHAGFIVAMGSNATLIDNRVDVDPPANTAGNFNAFIRMP